MNISQSYRQNKSGKKTPIDKIYFVPTPSAVQQQAQKSLRPSLLYVATAAATTAKKMSHPKKMRGQSSASTEMKTKNRTQFVRHLRKARENQDRISFRRHAASVELCSNV